MTSRIEHRIAKSLAGSDAVIALALTRLNDAVSKGRPDPVALEALMLGCENRGRILQLGDNYAADRADDISAEKRLRA